MAKRPNDFLCAVFSCYNDPRAPPSTDALLSLRLTRDGVRMGARGDSEDHRRRFGGESRRRVGKLTRSSLSSTTRERRRRGERGVKKVVVDAENVERGVKDD